MKKKPRNTRPWLAEAGPGGAALAVSDYHVTVRTPHAVLTAVTLNQIISTFSFSTGYVGAFPTAQLHGETFVSDNSY